jgi:hypothetical protein
MALSSFVGSFTANTGTGNQSITGVGFQPKALLFFMNSKTSDGSEATAQRCFGMAVSSTSRAAIAGVSLDNNATVPNADRRHDDTKCLSLIDASQVVIFAADLVSMDADGFTVNITTAATAHIVNFIALGGDDLTNVAIKRWTSATSTGNQGVTGVGFQPDCLINMTNIASGAPPANNTAAFFTIGFGKSSSQRGVMHETMGDNILGNDQRTQKTAQFIDAQNSGSTFFVADLVSLDADGFTVNWGTANGTARYLYALCLKGGQFKIGSFNQETGTGNKATTGIGFQPTGLILASFNNTSSTAIIANARNSFGAGSSSSARGSIWNGATASANPTIIDKDLDRTKIIKMLTEGTPTLNAAADLVSLDSDGFTLNWTTADATAREIIYLAVGSNAGGGTDSYSGRGIGRGILRGVLR